MRCACVGDAVVMMLLRAREICSGAYDCCCWQISAKTTKTGVRSASSVTKDNERSESVITILLTLSKKPLRAR